ncbi:MAG: questin oxidase family protein [Psychrosphaera sp.]|nr:questin oxidase family protein [Psychrosphaera sp.]
MNVKTEQSELVNGEILKDSHFHPNLGGITQGGMANHYPMTILSMQALGATDQQIVAFRNSWPRHRAHIVNDLHLTDTGELTAQNWPLFLGQSDKLREFRRVFLQLLAEGELAGVITNALAKMQHGLPMGLFHPLIRLSFAVMHGDTGIIADALAYMAIRYKDLYQHPLIVDNDKLTVTAAESWAVINKTLQSNRLSYPLGGTIRVCEQMCADSAVHQLAFSNGFTISDNNLDSKVADICQGAVKLYLLQPALTTLHAVTACQALADLTDRFATTAANRASFAKLWQLMWIWLTALYIEKGHPAKLPSVEGATVLHKRQHDWKQLIQMALQTREVHVMKMAFSCQWLFERGKGDELYVLAVVRMLG